MNPFLSILCRIINDLNGAEKMVAAPEGQRRVAPSQEKGIGVYANVNDREPFALSRARTTTGNNGLEIQQ